MRAAPVPPGDPEEVNLAAVAHWVTIVQGPDGGEHLALTDGLRRIRLDVREGTLLGGASARLTYDLAGLRGVEPRILTLRRFLALWKHRRFVRTLFPPERRLGRWLDQLRVADALDVGASQREMAEALFGAARVRDEWHGSSDSLRSRVRRLVREARRMAGGGYRDLLRSERGE